MNTLSPKTTNDFQPALVIYGAMLAMSALVYLAVQQTGLFNCVNSPQISDPRARFWDADFGPPEGGHLFGRYLQCKIKGDGFKIERVTY